MRRLETMPERQVDNEDVYARLETVFEVVQEMRREMQEMHLDMQEDALRAERERCEKQKLRLNLSLVAALFMLSGLLLFVV